MLDTTESLFVGTAIRRNRNANIKSEDIGEMNENRHTTIAPIMGTKMR
jgi:hypothetical protein